MIEKILRIRYLAIIINLFVVINTVALIVLGVVRTGKTILHMFTEGFGRHGEGEFAPGAELAESLDIFLIALVFLVFTVGINVLFIRHNDQKFIDSIPEWMRVKNFAQLKFLLMEAIITTTFVMFVSAFVKFIDTLDWRFILIPASILLLSVSLKLLKSGKH